MLKRISKLFDVSVQDPEDARRRRLLNVLLVYVGACAFLCAILLIVIPTVLINDGGQAGWGWGLVFSVAVIIMVPVLYTLNRRASGRLAQWLFVFFLLIVILLIYDPGQDLRGRGLLLFSLPIFLSSLLLRSWASFPMAAFCGLALAGLSYQTGRPLPSLLSFVDLFFLASVAWFSARGLERAARHAGQAESEIALLAKFPSENPRPVLRIARDGILLYANEAAFILMADWKLELGKPAPEALKRPIGEVFETHTEKTVDISYGERTFSISIVPAPEDECVNLYGWDVTEQKQAQQQLQQSEEKYRALFQNAQVGMYRSKLDGSAILAVNRKLCEIFEYSEEEMIGNPSTIRWADPSARDRMLAELRKTGALINYEIDIRTKNGKIRTCLISVHQNPELGYLEGSAFDITDRKRAEEEITRLAKFPSENPNPVLRLARNGTVLYANDASKTLLAEWGSAIERPAPRYWQEIAAESLEKKANNIIEAQIGGRTYSFFVAPIVGEDYVNLYGRDESERKRAEEALRESEDKFKYVFDNSVVGKSITLSSGEIHVNKAFCEMLGYSPEELQKIRWQDISDPADIDSTQKELDAIISGQKSEARFTKRYLHKNGSVVWVDVSTSLRRDGQGKPLYFITTVIDITDRKRVEEALGVSEAKYRLIADNADDWIYLTAPDRTILYTSPSCERVTGYTPKEFTDDSELIIKIVCPDDRQDFESHFMETQEKSRVHNKEFRILTKSGEARWISHSCVPVHTDEGQYAGRRGTNRDITERKRAEESLRESEQRLRRFYESGLVGVIYWNMDGKIVDANDKFLELMGYTRDDLAAGRVDWINMTPPEYHYLDEASVVELKATGANKAPLEKEYIRKDGTRLPIIVAGAMIDENRFNGVAFVLDITERKRAEEALNKTLADLERSNADLEQFAYVASHDLQEPLRMVSSYTQLLARRYKGKLDKDADEFIAYAVDGADNMQRLINDLLSYSRVGTRGKLPEAVPADAALDRALENLKMTIEENRAEIEREPFPTVTADDVQLTQVFQNLVGNAVKFHSDHPPRIRIACEARGNEWIFSVRDNGIGIDPQYLDRIFIIFQRLHKHGQYPGTGIGLAMCKKIIVRHGGRIWVESEPGKGSTFFFSLPKTGGQ